MIYTSTCTVKKKTFQTVPAFKRSRGDRAFCGKGPFNFIGHNGRTTAGFELHCTRDGIVHTVVSNRQVHCFFSTPEIEQQLKRVL